jgi:CRP/FNR family transcriptional regulator, anaerobic regulatory protein
MDTAKLFTFLREITDVSAEFEKQITSGLKQEFYKTHQIVLAKGQPDNRVWFVNSGFARSYFYDDHGQEHTIRFWHEREMIFSMTGFWTLTSMEYIEILEEAELFCYSYEELWSLLSKYHAAIVLIRHFIHKKLIADYQRQSICFLPAEQRYLVFRRNNPEVFKKAPLWMIASYLSMSRESLSRIISRDRG